jgi:hypothetical protein
MTSCGVWHIVVKLVKVNWFPFQKQALFVIQKLPSLRRLQHLTIGESGREKIFQGIY